MQIAKTLQRSDAVVEYSIDDDTIIINGVEYDFSPLEEGYILPQEAVECEWIVSDVKRINNEIHLTLIEPYGPEL